MTTRLNAKLYYNTRTLMPLMIGIITGFALSLLCSPFYDCADNSIASFGSGFFIYSTANNNHRLRHQRQQPQPVNSNQIDEYEPRINLQGKPKSPQKPVQKLVRPRYLSTELHIRHKLFVAILAVNTKHKLNDNLASFLNDSITSLYRKQITEQEQISQQTKNSKIIFFINNPNMSEKLLHDSTPPGLGVVNFNDDRDHLLPFHSLKYVVDNYAKNFDWFFFASDETFIRASKLHHTLNHMSVSQDLYMGYSSNDKHSVYCSLSAGIIFSNTLLLKMLPEIEWCTKNAYSADPSENIGRCVLHSANLACSKSANGHNSSFYLDETFDFERDISRLSNQKDFNNSLTVYRVKDIQTMQKLQIYFNQIEITENEKVIKSLETNILEMVCETPDGCDSLMWPQAAPSAYKALNRHEVIRWDYFNSTHLFLGTDFEVVSEMNDDYKHDINEIISFSLENLFEKDKKSYELVRLLNGYKQFDPTRGSAYILDLIVSTKSLTSSAQNDSFIQMHRRVNLMRPLGQIEILPMPYVTESPKITVVIAFICSNDQKMFKEIQSFFNMYQKRVLDVKDQIDRVNLFLVYLTNVKSDCTIKPVIRDLIQKKFSSLMSTATRVTESDLEVNLELIQQSESLKQFKVLDHVSKRLAHDTLIFYASFCVEFQADFLNRIRLNTVLNSQVFFPIPFSSYMPNIVYANRPFPADTELSKNYGYFNADSFLFASFYNADYMGMRNSTQGHKDLYDLFASNKRLHLLRATDQSLICRWSETNHECNRLTNENEMKQCKKQRLNGMGTKAHLAMHLMKYYDKIFN